MKFEQLYKQIVNENSHIEESIGKWIKNRTLNVTSNQIKKEMIHTFNEFVNNYHFKNDTGQHNTVSKKQDGYHIFIRTDWVSSTKTRIPTIVTVKNGNKVLLEQSFDFKDSFTEQDIAKQINKIVNKVSDGFILSSAVDNKSNSKSNNDVDDNDDDDDDIYQDLDSNNNDDQKSIITRAIKRNMSEAGIPTADLNKNVKVFLQYWTQLSDQQRQIVYSGLTGKKLK